MYKPRICPTLKKAWGVDKECFKEQCKWFGKEGECNYKEEE